MNVVDRCVCRYVQDAKTFSRWEYRLLALTGLFLAVNANAPDTLTVEDAVRLGNNGFDKEQIQGKEKEILQMLGNALHPPTPQKFLKLYFLALLGHNCNRYSKHVFQKANYLIELSIMEHFAVIYKPSQVALAATLNAFEDEDIALAPDKISLLQEIGVVEGLDSCQDYLRRL